MNYVIKRYETDEIREVDGWVLLYGRRKTGKTFLVKNFLDFDNYYYVRRDLGIINDEELNYEEFIKKIRANIRARKRVVVDEFQRLPSKFLDELSALSPQGKVILLGSSFGIVKKIFSPNSPLLGLLSQYRLDFISPKDTIKVLSKHHDAPSSIELATYLREPWLINFSNLHKGDITEFLYKVLKLNIYTIKSLIGEIFREEERELTRRYETILSLVGRGVWRTNDITGTLYNKGMIDHPDAGLVRQYIINLERMGLVDKHEIINMREQYHQLHSPIMELYYYLNSRYVIEEKFPEFSEVKPVIASRFPLHLQHFVAEVFREKYGGKTCYYISPEKEIDFLIVQRKKQMCVGEVKWRNNIKKNEIEKFIKNAYDFSGDRIFVSKKTIKREGVQCFGAEDLVKLILKT